MLFQISKPLFLSLIIDQRKLKKVLVYSLFIRKKPKEKNILYGRKTPLYGISYCMKNSDNYDSIILIGVILFSMPQYCNQPLSEIRNRFLSIAK